MLREGVKENSCVDHTLFPAVLKWNSAIRATSIKYQVQQLANTLKYSSLKFLESLYIRQRSRQQYQTVAIEPVINLPPGVLKAGNQC